jgi:hypothetical protein
LATERLIPGEHSNPIVDANVRKAIDIMVPVYKSVHLTIRCLNSLVDNIHEIAGGDPRLIVINDSPGESDVHRMLLSVFFGYRKTDPRRISSKHSRIRSC